MKGSITTIKADGTVEYLALDRPAALEELQAAVGGNLELVPLFDYYRGDECVVFCNEEGKLHGLPVNTRATEDWNLNLGIGNSLVDVLCGDVAVVQGDDEFMAEL